jgi:large subunit ribosomal protein L25
MYTLNVEKRDLEVKAKSLRKNGMIPCSISDRNSKEPILLQISDSEGRKMLREKGNGAKVILQDEAGNTYQTIIKNIVFLPGKNQIEDIAFQKLYEDEYVKTVARVILKNRDKVQAVVNHMVKEIPYRALGKHIVEQVEIDLTKLGKGRGVELKELSIWENENLKINMNGENLVVNLL